MIARLSDENQHFVDRQLAAGRYASAEEALNAGVDMLRRQELLDIIDEGRRQLDEGEYTEYDEEGLHRRLQELHERIDAVGEEREQQGVS
ncbi:MAG: hypothetical protein DWQ34_20475 [Planctomycetota bacterium]|nr:MAG: hypothetical protein DWQ34_20475 [Planctomycetota bacterium]REK29770.1 MAG: hypothetical protein DWQ41_03820 [Planctomycetota bacterium]REK30410.1 MAG: hypothetical protein DWQ45_21215 [Planctomycetota bacterium]